MSDETPPFDEAVADAHLGHLSMDELADLDEGLLPPERTSAARAHLQHCDRCGARAAALASTGEALRALGPVAIPAEVADRIDAALAAQAGQARTRRPAAAAAPDRTASAGVATPSSAEPTSTVVPELGEVRRRRFGRPTLPAAAAAAVIVLAITAVVVGHANHHGHSSGQQAGAESVEPLVGVPQTNTNLTPVSTGRTYDPSNLAAYVPALLSGPGTSHGAVASTTQATGAASSTDTTAGGAAGGAATAPSAAASPGRSAKSGSTLRQSTKQFAAPKAAPQPRFTVNAPVPAALARFKNSTAAVINCAAFITDTPDAVPEAVDFGRWSDPTISPPIRHKPALIMVFADKTSLASVDVYVVAPPCGQSSLLKFQKVALSS